MQRVGVPVAVVLHTEAEQVQHHAHGVAAYVLHLDATLVLLRLLLLLLAARARPRPLTLCPRLYNSHSSQSGENRKLSYVLPNGSLSVDQSQNKNHCEVLCIGSWVVVMQPMI